MKDKILHEKVEYKNIREMIESVGELYGEKPAFRFKIKPHDKECVVKSYAALRDDVRALATEFLARDYKGRHIVLLGKQTYSWIVTYFAAMAMGAVLVPLDKDWGAFELSDTVKTADTHAIICDKDQEAKVAEICQNTGVQIVHVIDGGEGSSHTLEALMSAGREKFAENSAPYYENEIDPDVLSLLVFTSGTTGKGKGVMLSQHNFCSDLADVIPYIDFSVRTLNVLPPHHTYGSSVSIYGQACIGCDIYISSGIKYILKELQEHKPGHLVAVPLYVETFYRRIVAGIKATGKEKFIYTIMKASNLLRKVGIDLRKKLFGKILEPFGGELNMIISGGAPLNQEVADLFDSIGVTVLNGYGITECAPIIAVNHNHYIVPKSVGPVLPIDDVKIDEPNEDGEGEILVKGPNIMLGYYKNEEATAEAFDEEGYFRTGDYGKMVYDEKNDNRVLYITGRKKNLIILANGKNVYPEEIEDALSATPGVLDLIVYEGKSKRGDTYNTIVMEVYPDQDFIKKNSIEDFKAYFQPFVNEYNKTATPYKKIGLVKVRDEEFPKNTLRKILRFKLDMTID